MQIVMFIQYNAIQKHIVHYGRYLEKGFIKISPIIYIFKWV